MRSSTKNGRLDNQRKTLRHYMLALCKFIWLRKQMTEVTYRPTLRPETSLSDLERALSET
jgi:hypothetical protein